MEDSQHRESSSTKNDPEQVIIEEKISKVNGDIAIKRYSKGKQLGKGGFAKVHELINLETKKVLAGKIIMKNSLSKNRARQKLISEIKIHKSLHHSSIVNFEHVFEDQENVYILLELCSNQTLNELLKRRKKLHEIEVQFFITQIISGLKYLHSVKVIHRDLKLGNVFLNDKLEVKIGDFGLATKLEFDGEKKRTICGTPNYIAPEVLDGKTGHSYEVDVWSLGVIIYTLLIGKPPFETPDVKTTYKKIKMNSYTFPEQHPISENAKNLITKILQLDPLKRPTLDEMMLHPFLNNGGQIPKNLPSCCLACPPSTTWLKQYLGPSQPSLKDAYNQPQLMSQPIAFQQNNIGGFNGLKTDNFHELAAATSNEFLNNNWKKDSFKPFVTNNADPKMNPQKSMKQFSNVQSPPMNSNSNMNSLPNLNPKIPPKTASSFKAEVWVKKWVDYSNKYGLGYLLSNGATGVFFNDSTKIVLDVKGSNFEYYERRTSDRQDMVSCYTLQDYPTELQKKITLLLHFKSYLDDQKSNGNNDINIDIDDGSKSQTIYVKKWMKTKHAIIFRLSNKIVQVNFTDKSEIILSSENKLVTYGNKKGERSVYPLQTALESNNHELSKRLKYTREILSHMLNNNAGNPSQPNQQEGDN